MGERKHSELWILSRYVCATWTQLITIHTGSKIYTTSTELLVLSGGESWMPWAAADLCLAHVLHGEVEPDSEAWVAGVRPDKKVKLKLTDVVDSAKVTCRGGGSNVSARQQLWGELQGHLQGIFRGYNNRHVIRHRGFLHCRNVFGILLEARTRDGSAKALLRRGTPSREVLG